MRGPGKAKEKDQLDEAEREGEQAGGTQSGDRDLDAEDVERYTLEHPGETPKEEASAQPRGVKHRATEEPEDKPADKYICVPPSLLGLDSDRREIGERAPTTPELPLPSASSEQVLDDSTVEESRSKAPRTDQTESPTSLHAPHYAGGVQQVKDLAVDEVPWEQEVADFEAADGLTFLEELFSDEVVDEGTPPEVGPDELAKIEAAAGQEEIHRLLDMGALEEPSFEDLAEGSILATRSVFDWRVRNGRWKRRCRFVARHDHTTAATFAPTSSLAATRLLLACDHAVELELHWRQKCIFAGSTNSPGVG